MMAVVCPGRRARVMSTARAPRRPGSGSRRRAARVEPAPGSSVTGASGGDDRRRRVEHLLDALGAHRGAGHHHGHERRHHHRHQDLREVAEEGDQRADLHLAAASMRSAPNHNAADARHVEHEHHGREHERHQPPGAQRGLGEVVVGVAEALDLVGLAHERPHDAHAGDLLAQHLVDVVDALLHLAELGHHPRRRRCRRRSTSDRDADEQDQRQPDVLAHRHDDAADDRDRRGDEQRARSSARASAPAGRRW